MLHTHLVMRDDGMHLFGFATETERELFLMLIGVQGVGPKVALAVLSGGRPRELLNAIAAGDAARFQAVPGIGKRTAERVIVELREKVAGRVSEEIVVRRGASDDPRTLARDGPARPWLLARRRPTACSRTPTGSHARGPHLRGAAGQPDERHPDPRGRARPGPRRRSPPRTSSTARCARAGSRTSSARSA